MNLLACVPLLFYRWFLSACWYVTNFLKKFNHFRVDIHTSLQKFAYFAVLTKQVYCYQKNLVF